MAQVNVAYEDRLLAHLDSVAEGRGLSRPDLLRAIAEEAVRAGEQGRAMFEPPKLPIDPGTAVTLALKVEQISIDLDRILRAAERREKRLVEAFHARRSGGDCRCRSCPRPTSPASGEWQAPAPFGKSAGWSGP